MARGIETTIEGIWARWQDEYRFLRRDGTHAMVLDRAYVLRDASGRALRMIGAMHDFTHRAEVQRQLEQSRERLRLALEATALGIWDFSPVDGKLRWDARCKELFGLARDAHVTYEIFLGRVHPDDRDRVAEVISNTLNSGKGGFSLEYRLAPGPETRDQVWLHATGQAFFAPDGKACRFVGTVQDVSASKRSEDELREAKEQAEQALRAKDNFLATLSHELRTPLTPVLMTAAALGEEERLPADVREQLAVVQRNVELEARLIDDLLDLTRITRGKLPLRIQLCDAHSLITLAVEIVQEDALTKEQSITLDLKAARTALEADPSRLQQVFWNLLRNAVKFTPAGGGIKVLTEDTGNGIRIRVTDTGIGIRADVLPKIFLPFEQGIDDDDHRFGGMGLGLSIARAIVELHGGRIRAESPGPDKGATFVIDLPAKQGPVRIRPAEPPKSASSTQVHPSRKLRLLVVEDHEQTLQVLSRLLRRAGHEVVTTSTVADALAAADTHSFDAVVSDLGLPDGTGTDLMKQLRSRHGLSGVALSGYGMEEDVRKSKESGFSIHLTKPVDFSQLRHALDTFKPRTAHPPQPAGNSSK